MTHKSPHILSFFWWEHFHSILLAYFIYFNKMLSIRVTLELQTYLYYSFTNLSLVFPPHKPAATTFLLYFFAFDLKEYSTYNDSMQYLSFSVWLISLSIVSSSSTHVVPNSRMSFFHMTVPMDIYIHCIFFIQSCVHGHLGCFYILNMWIMLQWTWECRHILDILFSFP